jgi:ferredoxin
MAEARVLGRISMSGPLRVKPILCAGHGLCAKLLPERITLDEWGYPLLSGEPVARGLPKLARRAVTACPQRALILEAST